MGTAAIRWSRNDGKALITVAEITRGCTGAFCQRQMGRADGRRCRGLGPAERGTEMRARQGTKRWGAVRPGIFAVVSQDSSSLGAVPGTWDGGSGQWGHGRGRARPGGPSGRVRGAVWGLRSCCSEVAHVEPPRASPTAPGTAQFQPLPRGSAGPGQRVGAPGGSPDSGDSASLRGIPYSLHLTGRQDHSALPGRVRGFLGVSHRGTLRAARWWLMNRWARDGGSQVGRAGSASRGPRLR